MMNPWMINCVFQSFSMNKKLLSEKGEQLRLREILGQPENGHLSFADLVYCMAISIKVFFSFVVSKIWYIFVNRTITKCL